MLWSMGTAMLRSLSAKPAPHWLNWLAWQRFDGVPDDGAGGGASEHCGAVAQAVVMLQQTGHGHAVFKLELLVAPG